MTTDITISDSDLRRAASRGADAFLELLTDRFLEAVGGTLGADGMERLNAAQHTLLAYRIFRDELMEGGFIQLIQNGYGAYIFCNPFARSMREWGLGDLAKLVYAAKKVYDAHREELEKERTDEEFMALYEQYEEFEEPEGQFIEDEVDFTQRVAEYADGHLDELICILPE